MNKKSNLEWWKNHNNVKHKRNEFYYQANLDNTVKSISALFICVNYYFKLVLSEPLKEKLNRELEFQDITRLLKSRTNFIRFQADYYDKHLLI
ncbi:MAG: hypothetical protein DRI75_03515 [Bacteroidetes bacterium]|nr:MAG: hypothetical protein DRI75_03515 [Bacteroidota bacterium]